MDESRAGLDPSSKWRRLVTVEPVINGRLVTAKRAFTTRRVPLDAMATLISGRVRPRPGDLVLARIERLGQHQKLELTTGRRARLHLGDEIIVAYAHRYAPDQFEAQIPTDLGPTQLVASGGVAANVLSRSSGVRAASNIVPIALVGDVRGRSLNLAGYSLGPVATPANRPPALAVIGTSMNSGKTTTIHHLVRGLALAGHAPGVCKVTGTGSGNDYWVMEDAGAHRVLDFTDVGMASTYLADFDHLERTTVQLIDHLAHAGCRSVLVEVADGLLQRETSRLIDSEAFGSRIDGVVFAAADAMGAIGGVARLRSLGLNVVAVAGRLTGSPLAAREVAAALNVPILGLDELSDPATASRLVGLEPLPSMIPAASAGPRTHTAVHGAVHASSGDEREQPHLLVTHSPPRPPTLAVIGTSMSSATNSINDLVRGLVLAGHRPGVCKVTGTATGNTCWAADDAVALRLQSITADASPAYLADVDELERSTARLIDRVCDAGCGSVLVEVTGGLLQRETLWLVNSVEFRSRIDGVVFVAADAVGAIGGVQRLRAAGFDVIAVTGRLTESPMASENAADALGLPVLTSAELSDPVVASRLLGLQPMGVEPGEVAAASDRSPALVVHGERSTA